MNAVQIAEEVINRTSRATIRSARYSGYFMVALGAMFILLGFMTTSDGHIMPIFLGSMSLLGLSFGVLGIGYLQAAKAKVKKIHSSHPDVH
jgi:hypothetical protein